MDSLLMCCAEETYWAIIEIRRKSRNYYIYIWVVSRWYIPTLPGIWALWESARSRRRLQSFVTVPYFYGGIVVNQFTAVFILCCSHIQLESFGVLSGSFPPLQSELLFAQWELHASRMSSRERFFGSLPTQSFGTRLGNFTAGSTTSMRLWDEWECRNVAR